MTLTQLKDYSTLLHHRVSSMVEDGYVIIHITLLPTGVFIYLRHRYNGRCITISADKKRARMRQFSDCNLVYEGNISG